ncbi:MAG: hypothetical protein ACR2OM_02045, partial [Aestuariivirgaceae bacterium]
VVDCADRYMPDSLARLLRLELTRKQEQVMIIAIVQIPLEGPKRPHELVVAESLESTRIFRTVKGLRRKYYLNNEHGGGGIYEFSSREDAEAWFNDGWADWMEGRFGARPTLTLFDNPVVLDNETGQVRVDGAPVPAPWRDSE